MATQCDLDVLTGTGLFSGIDRKAVPGLLFCIGASQKAYRKGALLIREGEAVSRFGLVLSGEGQAVKEDREGRLVILTLLKPGSEIGVILAACPGHTSPVSVQATQDMTVLSVPYEAMMARCTKACDHHNRLLMNYLRIVAEKGLVLHERIDCLLKPTVREKVMTYLRRVCRERGGPLVDVPMDRAEMADYLHVERSALSRELSRMKKEGLIDFYRNSFHVLQEKTP